MIKSILDLFRDLKINSLPVRPECCTKCSVSKGEYKSRSWFDTFYFAKLRRTLTTNGISKKVILGFVSIFSLILSIDQLTKFYALHNFINSYKINNYISFDLAINRGVSWSLFDTQNSYVFFTLSTLIFLVLSAFTYYTFLCLKNNQNVIPEILVISGGISNLIDRITHSGVVDFILISYKNFCWPLFNFADICIVFGALLMLIKNFKD